MGNTNIIFLRISWPLLGEGLWIRQKVELTANNDRYIELSSFFFFLDNLISAHSCICDSSPTALDQSINMIIIILKFIVIILIKKYEFYIYIFLWDQLPQILSILCLQKRYLFTLFNAWILSDVVSLLANGQTINCKG